MGRCICCKHLHNFTVTFSKILVAVLSKFLCMQESNQRGKNAGLQMINKALLYFFMVFFVLSSWRRKFLQCMVRKLNIVFPCMLWRIVGFACWRSFLPDNTRLCWIAVLGYGKEWGNQKCENHPIPSDLWESNVCSGGSGDKLCRFSTAFSRHIAICISIASFHPQKQTMNFTLEWDKNYFNCGKIHVT